MVNVSRAIVQWSACSVKVKAEEITLTFTEPDGEVEDYQIPVHNNSGKGTTFQQEDDHIVKHIKRDPIIVTLVEKGVSHASDTLHKHLSETAYIEL